ncbi:phosphodiester glycosidase family protein [Fibrella forsythiae]|uniref:Phosphodiester glycosidase family protein n=1 Tax=Fibrella forsythiae TaxID=2817061 RepID=A0ABS3JLY7_9BACT|nr:phosphodiester glycosidase family protein [Fibrella forsythiae]MBO0951022.1 phosphodiester glycosidase family protein [Fibrella forsythiae]
MIRSMRFLPLSLCCLLTVSGACQTIPGTSADSLRLLNRPAAIQFRRGLEWQSVRLDTLFGSPQNINILRLRPGKWRLAFGSAGDSLRTTSRLGREKQATAALNGTFFSFKGGSVDHIKIDGYVLDTTRYTPGKKLEEHRQAAIVLTKRGKAAIVFGGADNPRWASERPEPNVMVTGPLLLKGNKRAPLQPNAFNDNRHPRTCFCLTNDRHVLLITADGRHKNAAGFSLPELTTVLRWLGCRDAINLDGGGSTTLWLSGQPDNGVVNYPSDSKQWIHTGERPVSNVLLVHPR